MNAQKWIIITAGLVLLGFAAAQTRPLPTPGPDAVANLGAIEAMALANAWGRAGMNVQSFVTPQAVQFKFDGGRMASVALPNDRMVVAVAPYINRTHPCKTHFMSGCQGELVGVPVEVTARTTDGKTVFKGTVRTLENGFFELWLPRELNLILTVEAQGKKATGPISTLTTSDTCVTTLKLQ